ncbi:DUF1796 family putative cysteine peptidase [Vibrio rotiferianus]|uniref:DUF1796 family putative cysteine peptidase n=1 Tax=Vibrio rotiferianus TaxID=190895 RepID=UPI0015F4406A|nr:DUF1796 family putative cysteine peptidase [Vibrio rotiferianus]
MKYYSVLPIGDNCEIAGHLVRNGYQESSLFRFAFSNLNNICNCIRNNFRDVLSKNSIYPESESMIKCKVSNISWHTKLNIKNSDSGFKLSCSDTDYNKEIEKFNHLKSKTIRLLNNSDSILFIYKSNSRKYENLIKFCDLISTKYENLKFKVLVIKEEEDPFETKDDRIDIRKVKYLAPYSKAMTGGDDASWDEILKDYLYISPFKNMVVNGSEPADYLRDTALIFEKEGDIVTANKLMFNAHLCRPTGSFIKIKLKEYEKILALG